MKQTLRQTRSHHMSAPVMACFAPFILMLFYCSGWRTDCFDNLTAKGFNLQWCKSKFRRPILSKITGKLPVFDVSAQIQTNTHVSAPKREFLCLASIWFNL